MAAFSPKDLMSPMKKMEAALEEIKDSTEQLVGLVTGVCEVTGGGLTSISESVASIADTLTAINRKMDVMAVIKKKDKGEDSEGPGEKLKKGVELFKTFGIGIKDFALGMLMFRFVPEKTAENLTNSVQKIAEALAEVDKQTFDNAAKLGEVGQGIFKFTGWMLLSALLVIPALIAIPLIALEIWLFSQLLGGKEMNERLGRAINNVTMLAEVGWGLFVFEGLVVLAGLLAIPAVIVLPLIWLTVWATSKMLGMLAKNSAQIVEGTLALVAMAAGLIVFSIGILLFGLATRTLDFKSIIMGALVIGIIGLTCRLLGDPNIFPYVILGALALVVMSLPLLILSVSLLIFALAMKMIDDKMPMKMMKLIICLGIAFAVVGAVSSLVMTGGVAMLIAGVALVVLGIGLMIFSLTLKLLDKGAEKKIASLIIALGLAFAAAGALSVPILLGAVAMLTVGASLIVLGIGLIILSLALKLLKPEEQERIPMLIISLGLSFAAAGALSVPIILGSVAMITVGVSIIILGIGLMVLSLALKVLKPEEQERIPDLLVTLGTRFSLLGVLSVPILLGSVAVITIGAAILTLSIGLLAIGGAMKVFKQEEQDRLGPLLISMAESFALVGLLSIPMLLGAAATITAGAALMAIMPGLLIFKKVGWKEGDAELLSDAIMSVRNGFLGISKDDGVFTIIKKVAASTAASAALLVIAPGYIAAGIAMQSLAKGLTKVKELNWKEENDEALFKMLSTVSAAFAQVAKAGTVTKNASFGGLFGKLLGGFSIEKSAVAEGIDSVKGAGKAIKDISEGLVEFTKWYEKNRKLLDMKSGNSPFFDALKTTITSISEAFAIVGGDENYSDPEGIFAVFKPKESKVQKGIKAVEGVGTTLKDISEGLIKFTEWFNNNKKKISMDDPNSEFFVALKTTLTSVSGAFAAIGGDPEYLEQKSFGPFKWNDNKVEEGIESVEGVGEALNGILDGVIKFTDFYNKNKKDLESTTFENVNGHQVPKGGLLGALNMTISSIGKAFASLGGEENEYSSFLFFSGNAVEDGIEAVEDVDEALEAITKGVQTFINANIKEEQINNVTKLITSLGEFGKLADVDIDDVGDDFEDFSKTFLKGLDNIYEKKDNTTRMKNINVLLLNMEHQVRFRTFDKAADGIKKISDAVNSIDVEKGRAFSDLFVAASSLKDNSRFYQDLVKAIEDIRNLLQENGIGGREGGGNKEGGGNNPTPTRTNNNNNNNNNRNQNNNNNSNSNRGEKTIKAQSVTIQVDGPVKVI